MFYKKLRVRLVIFSGATCRYVHTPSDWATRAVADKHTVVLNVWSGHVFTYDRAVPDRQFKEHTVKPLPEIALITVRDDQERYNYEEMLSLDWSLLFEKYQEDQRGTVF